MALSKSDIEILEHIISSNGDCMESSRCQKCPLKDVCLPGFLNPVPPSKDQRAAIALNVLSHYAFDVLFEDQ